MNWAAERRTLILLVAGFTAIYFLPVGVPRFDAAVGEALALTRWYAREHVILCLLPAFLIAGAIASFISQGAVMRYLGPQANRPLAYGVASVSGSILAVCSCTVLPLFMGIYRMGAGLGPAVAFLYSGPAINVLAIILTANVLGWKLGLARALGAIGFSVVIGALMHVVYRREEQLKAAAQPILPDTPPGRPLHQTVTAFALMIAILVLANWAHPDAKTGFFSTVWSLKWPLTATTAAAFAVALCRWYGVPARRLAAVGTVVLGLALISPATPGLAFLAGFVGLIVSLPGTTDANREWLEQTWTHARQIVPLLLAGVLGAGLLLGRPGHEGLVPSAWIVTAVGGEGWLPTLMAAAAGAMMYFATLTEIPVLEGLLGGGMGQGPALALLLAGPSLSLPNILVIRAVLGTRKTLTYVALVVVIATLCGWVYGNLIV